MKEKNDNRTEKQKRRDEQFLRLQKASATAKAIKKAMINEAKDNNEAFALMVRPLNWFIIKFIYRREEPEITELKSFLDWKKEGFSVKKGEKGYPVWSLPKSSQYKVEKEMPDGSKEEETRTGHEQYHMAYLFSDLQVEKAATA